MPSFLNNWWIKSSIGTKLNISSWVMAAGAVVLTMVMAFSLWNLNQSSKHLNTWNQHLDQTQSVALTAKAIANDERGFLISGDQKFTSQIADRQAALAKQAEGLKATAPTAAERAAVTEIHNALATWASNMATEVSLYADDPKAATEMAMTTTRDSRKVYEKLLAAHTKSMQKIIAEEADFSTNIRNTSLAIGVTLLIFGVLSTLIRNFTIRGIQRRIEALRDVVVGVEQGDLTLRREVKFQDELGTLTNAFSSLVDTFQNAVRKMHDTAGTLEGAANGIVGNAEEASHAAQRVSTETTRLSGSSQDIASQITSAASGAGEMSTSIVEISTNANEATQVVSEAVDATRKTQETVVKLGDSSQEIGDVVKTINGIAAQTNLLALNATIEAARAGAAGAGFVVVANEVKELAQETARATEDISARVENIQVDSKNAAEAISHITEIISQIDNYQTTIAAAVEEQTATTSTMGASMSEVSQATTTIANGLADMEAASASTMTSVSTAAATAQELQALSRELEEVVTQFKV